MDKLFREGTPGGILQPPGNIDYRVVYNKHTIHLRMNTALPEWVPKLSIRHAD